MGFQIDTRIIHDLKEPIRSINALATLILEDTELNQETRDYITKIKERSIQLNGMIQAIRDLAINEEINSKTEIIHLEQLISGIKKKLTSSKQFEIEILNELPSVEYNRVRIHQIFENLLLNAINFNNKEKVEIKISCKRTDGFWEICIFDNGMGIEDHFKSKVFDLFYSTKTYENKKGIGSGLTLVKNILLRNGGNIWFETEKNIGSKFYFTIKV